MSYPKLFRVSMIVFVAVTVTTFVGVLALTQNVEADEIRRGYEAPIKFSSIEAASASLEIDLKSLSVGSELTPSLVLGSRNQDIDSFMIQQNWRDDDSQGGVLFFEQNHPEGAVIDREPISKYMKSGGEDPDRYIRTVIRGNTEYAIIGLIDGDVTRETVDLLVSQIN